MFKIAYDPLYAHPLPEGHRFPMLKYELIPMQLLHEGVINAGQIFSPNSCEEKWITLTHNAEYWQKLRDLTLDFYEERRTGFPVNQALVERELKIVQGTIDGCHFALEDAVAFNVAGGTHHAGLDWGEGFCLLNDQAIAANYLLSKGLVNKILIIDLDVHQGNGTAAIFKNNAAVFTFSMHGQNNFPFRKEVSDLDIGLPDDLGDEAYLELLSAKLSHLFDSVKPDFVFFLSGVDVLETDKLGKLALSVQGCQRRDQLVFEECYRRAIPVQVSMGGGYSADIRIIVDAHCNTFKTAKDIYF